MAASYVSCNGKAVNSTDHKEPAMSDNAADTNRIPAAENTAFTGSSTHSPNGMHAKKAAGLFRWSGARVTARSALAAVVVMMGVALATSLGTTAPVLAASVSAASQQGASTAGATASVTSAPVAGNKICVISAASDDACDSSTPELILDSVNNGNTEGCKFTWKIYWGTGSPETVTDDGGPASEPTIIKAIHFYQEPKETTIYNVYWDAVSVTGGCYINSGDGTFVLLPPSS
jgi:hypothetical protein